MSSPSSSLQVQPTSVRMLALIDAVARKELGRHDLAGDALARAVRRVSEAYRRQQGSPRDLDDDRSALAARLRFFLPRDLPKIQAPLIELASVGAFPKRDVLRVLDVGAGLGTTSLGAAAFALEHLGIQRVQIDAFDADAAVLAIAGKLFARAADEFGYAIELRTHTAPLGPELLARAAAAYDLVLLGFVLNELGDTEADPVAHHHAWLTRLCERLAPDGALIVLEPALRTTSRTLQQVRGLFAAAGGPPHVFAPCLHCAACPLLERERDWCHEQQPLALPPALAALARAAGLRSEDLSYSYLTLHRAQRSLAELDARAGRDATSAHLYRITSAALASKGKIEVAACGAGPARKLRRLDRNRSSENRALAAVDRGQIVRIAGGETDLHAVLDVQADTRVEVVQRVAPD